MDYSVHSSSTHVQQLSAPPAPQIAIPIEAVVLGSAGLIIASLKYLLGAQLKHWQERFEETELRLEEALKNQSVIADKAEHLERALQDALKDALPAKALQRDFDIQHQRFENLSNAFIELQRLYQTTQKDFLALQTKLGDTYVRREDWIRFGSTLEAKLDKLNAKIDEQRVNLINRMATRDD